MTDRLSGHHALVTGGGTGIGAAIARALAAEGAKLTLVGRRRKPLEDVASDFEAAAVATADVSEPEQIETAFAEARAAHGPVTILVANAGLAPSSAFAKTSAEDWRAVMATNLDGVFHCCKAALADLLDAETGRIVAIASVAGLRGFAYTAAYTASKHGVVGLMRALAAEYAGKGLTANAVCPGFVDTNIVAQAARTIASHTGRGEDEARAGLAQLNPSGRLITSEEVAAAVVDLVLSDRTGEALEIA